MQTKIGPDFFSQNRAKLRQEIDPSVPIILTGNGLMQRGADEPSAFHQDSNFWYLTGLDIAELTLVMYGSDTFVLVPDLSLSRQAFDGAHDLAAYANRSGITDFVDATTGWQRIRNILQTAKQVATLGSPPTYLPQYGLHSLPFRRRLLQRLKRYQPGLITNDVRPQLAGLRAVKQPEELMALQAAIDVTLETLQEIAEPNRLGEIRHEYELEAALSYGFRRRGASGHAFAPIVGAGAHSTTLHYLKNDGPVGRQDLIVLDVGAEVEHYAADITRTISKQPITGRRAEVFHAVKDVQDYALTLLRPGTLAKDYERAVEAYMGQTLKRLGLITTLDHVHIRRYFPHATSHFLGLDTHDVGDYTQPWAAGMVLTCEPGVYIPEEQIGVRLEDDVYLTPDGNQVLSNACPAILTPVQ